MISVQTRHSKIHLGFFIIWKFIHFLKIYQCVNTFRVSIEGFWSSKAHVTYVMFQSKHFRASIQYEIKRNSVIQPKQIVFQKSKSITCNKQKTRKIVSYQSFLLNKYNLITIINISTTSKNITYSLYNRIRI